MARFESGTTLDLAARESVVLADVQGTTLRVNRGTVWITQENDTRDIVLRAGDTWMVERRGRTIVEAQADASLRGTGTAIAKALGRPTRRRARASAAWRRFLTGWAAWWSLTPRRHIPYL